MAGEAVGVVMVPNPNVGPTVLRQGKKRDGRGFCLRDVVSPAPGSTEFAWPTYPKGSRVGPAVLRLRRRAAVFPVVFHPIPNTGVFGGVGWGRVIGI